jgi:hypothetical protein
MVSKRDLDWNGFGLGVADSYIFNDRVNQSTLGKLIEAIVKFLDADFHIICWVALEDTGLGGGRGRKYYWDPEIIFGGICSFSIIGNDETNVSVVARISTYGD